MGTVRVATCQFEVTASAPKNAESIRMYMRKAKKADAEIVHFSEAALCGYAGANFESLEGYDWDNLRTETLSIMALAKELGLYVVLPSMHRLTPPHKPHNCLYLINPRGLIEDRYDKRFCTVGDLGHYTPGNRFVSFTINGVKCTLLICFDLRFPEIYRSLCDMGVQCIFQSFYNAGSGLTVHTHIMRQTMQCHAGTNYFWVSMANTSGPRSPYPSCLINPEGVIVNQLRLNKPGMMINTVDTAKSFYDPSGPFRLRAIHGALTNGDPNFSDPRSSQTTTL